MSLNKVVQIMLLSQFYLVPIEAAGVIDEVFAEIYKLNDELGDGVVKDRINHIVDLIEKTRNIIKNKNDKTLNNSD